MTGADVTRLQIFLIAQNAGAAAQKLKVNGTTQNFASLTKAALIEFQKKEGIAPAIGYFGPDHEGVGGEPLLELRRNRII